MRRGVQAMHGHSTDARACQRGEVVSAERLASCRRGPAQAVGSGPECELPVTEIITVRVVSQETLRLRTACLHAAGA